MQKKIRIRLPATLTHFGASLHSVGLALNLYTEVEVIPRSDDQLIVETAGEGAGFYALGLRHPAVLGMSRIFQKMERAPLGITLRITNGIPLQSGLGAEATFTVAGIVAASNLLGNPFKRDQLIEQIARISQQPHAALASMLGGLTAHIVQEDYFTYRSLAIKPFQFVLAIPKFDDYSPPSLPPELSRREVFQQANAFPLMVEALREGDLELFAHTINHQLNQDALQKQIKGYGHIAEVARSAGATAITTSGGGPAMIFLAEDHHDLLVKELEEAFTNLGIAATVKIASIDTQGIVMSMVQASG